MLRISPVKSLPFIGSVFDTGTSTISPLAAMPFCVRTGYVFCRSSTARSNSSSEKSHSSPEQIASNISRPVRITFPLLPYRPADDAEVQGGHRGCGLEAEHIVAQVLILRGEHDVRHEQPT